MASIDPKKLASKALDLKAASKPASVAPEGEPSESESAAQTLIDAVQAGDVKGVDAALKAHYDICRGAAGDDAGEGT